MSIKPNSAISYNQMKKPIIHMWYGIIDHNLQAANTQFYKIYQPESPSNSLIVQKKRK